MKCFVVLLAVVAACQCRSLTVAGGADQGYTLRGAYGKQVYYSRPYGPNGEGYIEIAGNGYYPNRKIEVAYPYGDVLAQIFSGYSSGPFDVDQYQKFLARVEQAVENGQVGSSVYEFLQSYDLFAPYGQYAAGASYPSYGQGYAYGYPYGKYNSQYGYSAGYPSGQYYAKYYSQYGFPYGQYFAKYYGYGYPQYGAYSNSKYYGQNYPSYARYYKSSPYFWQQLANYAKYYGAGAGYGYPAEQYTGPYNYESEYYGNGPAAYSKYYSGPYNYDSEYYGPYNYESEYYPYYYGSQYYGANSKYGYNYGR